MSLAQRYCAGKLCYRGKKYAKSMAARRSLEIGEAIMAYKCGECHAWHLGHTPGSKGAPVTSNCRSCGAEIMWVLTEGGKQMPLDTLPSDDGNVFVSSVRRTTARGVLPVARVVDPMLPLGLNEVRYVSHFVTCPNADEHRRARS